MVTFRVLHLADLSAPRLGTSARDDEVTNAHVYISFIYLLEFSPGRLSPGNSFASLPLAKKSLSHLFTHCQRTMTYSEISEMARSEASIFPRRSSKMDGQN
jgi:hypothetical protein